mgnify:CR=1 FL=1
MDSLEKREKALIIWECALWMCQPEMREVAEELVEYIRAARAFPKAKKQEIFFGEQ